MSLGWKEERRSRKRSLAEGEAWVGRKKKSLCDDRPCLRTASAKCRIGESRVGRSQGLTGHGNDPWEGLEQNPISL